MLIEEPEVLKQWLTTHLEPLCDADPAALAKYVLALIKKDKPKSELKESMMQQMDVFLQSETNSFIEMLFKVVEAKEYLTPSNVESAADARTSIVKAELEAVEAKIEAVADSTTPVREEKLETKKKYKSPTRDRRLAARLGPKESSRRFRSRSRSRSLSPRYERVRSRRRSRSPPYREMRRRSLEYILRRGRSTERVRYITRDTSPRDEATGYTPTVIAKRPRCRDYDEKGFCLRGDLCRYDHGMDAVVLEDAAKAVHAPPYVPGVPPSSGIPYPPPSIPLPPPGYPGVGAKRPLEGAGHEPPYKVGRGRGRGRGGLGRGGAMLAVRNIPEQFNTITHLNGHFSRYGSLVNVQVQHGGDPSSALITFSSNEDASLAFNSSEAVMNNRFIKMFWHNEKPAHVKNRLGGGPHGKVFNKHDSHNEELDPEKAKELKEKEMVAIKKNQEMLQIKNELLKKAEEKKKAVMAQQGGILKSKRDLLDGLIEQQKALITKLEKGKGTMKTDEKTKVMSLLKELSNSIDKTKEDIKNMISISGLKKRSKAEVQKELLDAEMELFSAQNDPFNKEVETIQQKVNSLQIEAARIGILPTSKAPRGRGKVVRGRGRGFSSLVRGGSVRGRGVRGRGGVPRGGMAPPVASTVDRRPSMILVTGFPEDCNKEDLINHFRKFGDIVENSDLTDSKSIILKYNLRKQAQSALNEGKLFNEASLELCWYTPPLNETSQQENTAEEGGDEDNDGSTPYQEDYLPPGLQEEAGSTLNESEINENLLDDEEEDGAEEERSWKRRNNEEE